MTRTLFAGIALLALVAGCDNKPAEKPAETPVAATTPAPAAKPPLTPPPADLTFEEAVAKFDAATQHLVWVLPPGIIAKGPFEAKVSVKADGKETFANTIPLEAQLPASGTRPEYPAGAVVLRLSADKTYPDHLKAIQDAMGEVKTKYGPGHGELNVSSDFKTEIAEGYRKEYCGSKTMPPISVYLEWGEPSTLQKLPLGAGGAMLEKVMLSGCAGIKPPPK